MEDVSYESVTGTSDPKVGSSFFFNIEADTVETF